MAYFFSIVSGAANSSKLTLQERATLKNNSDNSPPQKQIGYQLQQQQLPYQPYQPPHQQQQQQDLYPPHQQSRQPSYEDHSSYEQQAAPPYQQTPHAYGHQSSYGTSNHSAAASAPPAGGGLVSPRPPVPAPPPSRTHYVLALYDYDAQAEGDLSFKKDDKIELVNRTEDANDWWTGKLRGVVGVFPGNS